MAVWIAQSAVLREKSSLDSVSEHVDRALGTIRHRVHVSLSCSDGTDVGKGPHRDASRHPLYYKYV